VNNGAFSGVLDQKEVLYGVFVMITLHKKHRVVIAQLTSGRGTRNSLAARGIAGKTQTQHKEDVSNGTFSGVIDQKEVWYGVCVMITLHRKHRTVIAPTNSGHGPRDSLVTRDEQPGEG
jgi:hypothetical protein